jgi:hypothetical protein
MKEKLPLRQLKIIVLLALSLSMHQSLFAQEKTIKYEVESQTIGTTKDFVPFWFRSNQYGSVPLSGVSQSFIGRAYKGLTKPTDSHPNGKVIDWAFGFEGRANLGNGSNLQLIEGYGKLKVGIFNLTAGRTKNVMGLNGDTALSSGNFSVSGNASGIPGVDLSIPEYYRIPVIGGLISFKGNFVHGWVGRQWVSYPTGSLKEPVTYLHQKSLYVRLGKKDWKINLYGGFNHQAYWGNENDIYGPNFDLSGFETFTHVLFGQKYFAKGVPNSKIGNQIGSIDLGAEYEFDNFKVMLYRQNFYDVGALSKLANIADGLNGVTFENKNYNKGNSVFKWKKILAEVFYSKDQAGYPWSKATDSGDEDYYNNFYYGNGWTYKGMGLGSPLITQKSDAKEGQAAKLENFINNRVLAFHLGLEGSVEDWEFLTKVTYSNNFGTYGTSKFGHSLGQDHSPASKVLFTDVNQFSFYLESMKQLNHGLSTGFATSFDQGKLLNNSFGLILKVRKSFN